MATESPTHDPVQILLLTSQYLIAEMVKLTLNHGVFAVRQARDFEEAASALLDWRPDLVIADMDGSSDNLIARIQSSPRPAGPRLPIIALTRRGDLQAKLAVFDQGGDDILTVPLAPEELLARAIVITRRALGQDLTFNPVIKLGEIEIDILHRVVRAGSSEIHLTGLEQSLLYLLAANAGEVITRDQILDTLWGTDFVAESNIVDRHVRALRIKLQNDWRQPRFIATVPGAGYRFIPTFTNQNES